MDRSTSCIPYVEFCGRHKTVTWFSPAFQLLPDFFVWERWSYNISFIESSTVSWASAKKWSNNWKEKSFHPFACIAHNNCMGGGGDTVTHLFSNPLSWKNDLGEGKQNSSTPTWTGLMSHFDSLSWWKSAYLTLTLTSNYFAFKGRNQVRIHIQLILESF
jgi:hypothetical protein